MKQNMTERRASERVPIHLDGQIAQSSQPPIKCVVWDLSRSGVRIVVSDVAEIPLEFSLQIPGECAQAGVRLVWSDGIHYGAIFTG